MKRDVKRRQNVAPVDRAQAVVDTFGIAWDGYYQYAFPNDALRPVTNSFDNSRYTLIPKNVSVTQS
jgi:mannosyl-oligosaccharide alpha-1,2-mannosidase